MQRRKFLQLGLAATAAALLPLPGRNSAEAAGGVQLVMFGSRGCPSCIDFHRQAESRYRNSKLGARMPLVVRDISDGTSGYLLNQGIRYTPTFVVVKNGEEMERFVGYSGTGPFMRTATRLGNKYAAAEPAPSRRSPRATLSEI